MPGAHQHPLELRAGAQELLVLLLGAVAHHPLDVRAVVPAAVEQDHLAGGRQVLDVPLEVPLGALPLGGLRQRDHPDRARAGALGDPLDDAALAGRAAALEDHQHLEALPLDPVLQLHQLLLQPLDLLVVDRAAQPALLRVALRVAVGGVAPEPASSAPSGSVLAVHRPTLLRCRDAAQGPADPDRAHASTVHPHGGHDLGAAGAAGVGGRPRARGRARRLLLDRGRRRPAALRAADRRPHRPTSPSSAAATPGCGPAIRAKQRDPGRRVLLLEAGRLGWAASGRNGGFCAASLTHGEENGRTRWPDEYDALVAAGRGQPRRHRADRRATTAWPSTGSAPAS